jgi:hypothetical protein
VRPFCLLQKLTADERGSRGSSNSRVARPPRLCGLQNNSPRRQLWHAGRIFHIVPCEAGFVQFMQLQYEITPEEHLELVKTHRSLTQRVFTLSLGGMGLLTGITAYPYLDHAWSLVLIFVSGWLVALDFLVPYIVHWKEYGRNRRLFGTRTVNIDERGIVADGPQGRMESAWSNYEHYQETENLFLMYHTSDVVGLVPKKAFKTPDDLEQFRKLLASKLPCSL